MHALGQHWVLLCNTLPSCIAAKETRVLPLALELPRLARWNQELAPFSKLDGLF